MPLSQAREADTHAEDFTSEPAGVTSSPAADVDGLWAEVQGATLRRTILYFFGGGYVLGTPATRRKTAGHLALAAKSRVLLPNYRLAPEHPFPAALEDALRAYQWLHDHSGEASKTVLAGDSSGGGLAIAAALALRDHHLPMCGGIVAISPWADLTCSGESRNTRAAVDIECTRDGLLEMAGQYIHGADPAQPLASPVFADLAGSRHYFVWLAWTRHFSMIPFVWCAMLVPLESTQRCLSRRECNMCFRSGLALSPKQTRRLH